MTSIAEVLIELEKVAPPNYQESYDNSGLIFGEPSSQVKGILLCLDVNEAVLDEAIATNCNLIVSHHPLVFSALKRFSSGHFVERCLVKAIKNDVALYACHTNLDNVLNKGVNQKIAEKLGLKNSKILSVKEKTLCKISTYVPESHRDEVLQAMFNSGAGGIGNYDHCSFSSVGIGTFKGNDNSTPFVGKPGLLSKENETKVEVVCEVIYKNKVVEALKEAHPYEEVAFDVILLENSNLEIGSGLIGELEVQVETSDFPNYLKKSMKVKVVKYTSSNKKFIKKVAVCGGSGSFLIKQAKQAGADVFVTSDVKYHDFFEGDNDMMICDIGHYESEIFTLEIFHEIITKKFANFAVRFTEVITNPVNYSY